MIVGVGIDVVPVARFAEVLERTPSLARRLFTDAELTSGHGEPRTAESLGVTHWHVSLSHDGGIAAATVIAESAD